MKKFFTFWVIVFFGSLNLNSQISISDNGNDPDKSAMLDVQSNNSPYKGFLIPRLTLTQRNAISNPATGLLIYQTDNTPGFYYNAGTPSSPNWVRLGTGNGSINCNTANYIPKSDGTSLICSNIFDNGTTIGINATSGLLGALDIRGGEVRIWDGSATVNYATGQRDLYIEDELEVDGTIYGYRYRDSNGNLLLNGSGGISIIEDGDGSYTISGSGIADHDWYDVTTAQPPLNNTNAIYRSGNVNIGTTNAHSFDKLYVVGDYINGEYSAVRGTVESSGNVYADGRLGLYQATSLPQPHDVVSIGFIGVLGKAYGSGRAGVVGWSVGGGGSANYGIYGASNENNSGARNYAIYGRANGGGTGTVDNYAIYGYANGSGTGTTNNYAIYGRAESGTTNWAGYFQGNVGLGNTTTASELRFYEPTGGGTNYTAFKATTQSADITYTLPSTQGAPGTYLKNDGSGNLSWDIPSGGGGGWLLTGNAGTVDGTNFLGTTDNVPFTIKVKNQKAGRIGINNKETFFGYQAGNAGNASYAVGIGYRALYSNTSGSSNVAVGGEAMYSNTTGGYNTAIGDQALYTNTTGVSNVAIGNDALFYNTASYNVGIGDCALLNNSNGTDNTAIGYYAMYSNTSGTRNTAVGSRALRYNSTGSNNVAVGEYAGYGASGVNFNNCTFIGEYSYPTVARSNVTMLGYGITNAQCTGDNQVLLGNTAITQIRAQVTSITSYSDRRFKFDIKEDVVGLDFIKRLKPVSFFENPEILHQIWGTPDSIVKRIDHTQIKNVRFVGFVAQDVEEAMKESGYTYFPGIDIPKNEKEVYCLRIGDFIPPIVKAIQEQQQIIEDLKEIVQKQEMIIQRQEEQITLLKSQYELINKKLVNVINEVNEANK